MRDKSRAPGCKRKVLKKTFAKPDNNEENENVERLPFPVAMWV
jgi:hypothetical protein